MGKPTYRGITVVGTEQAIAEELDEAFTAIAGPKGEAMRERILKMRSIVELDRQEGGRTFQALLAIGDM